MVTFHFIIFVKSLTGVFVWLVISFPLRLMVLLLLCYSFFPSTFGRRDAVQLTVVFFLIKISLLTNMCIQITVFTI